MILPLVKSPLKTLLLIAFGIGLGSVNAILRAPGYGWICLDACSEKSVMLARKRSVNRFAGRG
jgi:hypothetical protein